MSSCAQNKITKARVNLVLEHAFFAHLAMKLELKKDSICQTAWCDGRTLGYSPDYIKTLPSEQITGILAHEVLHLVFGHHLRRKQRARDIWNIATDYAINGILLDSGFVLPQGYLFNSEYKNLTAEKIYDLLIQNPEPGRKNNSGKNPSQTQADEKNPGHIYDPGKTGEVRDHPGLSGGIDDGMLNEDQIDFLEQDLSQNLIKAKGKSARLGQLSQTLLKALPKPSQNSMNWRDILKKFIENQSQNDYLWNPPNRRHLHSKLLLPSLKNRELTKIVVAIDTSDSVDKEKLGQFCQELSSILEEYDTNLTVLHCDSKVQKQEDLRRIDLPLKLTPQGGGGTDFRPAFEYVDQQDLRPACFLYFTDLKCELFPQEPDFPVLWVCSQKTGNVPLFGELVLMES